MGLPDAPAPLASIPRVRRFSNTWVRIAASYTVLVLITAGVLILLLGDEVVDREEAALRARLSDQARAVGHEAAPLFATAAPLTATNTLAHAYSTLFATRVTLIRPDGVVVGDSEEDPRVMENHARRPEVRAVLADPVDPGSSRRLSATVHRQLLYVAVAVVDPAQPGRVVGVARVAYPLTSVEQVRGTLWATIATGVLLVSTAAAVLGILLVRSIVGPLSTLRDTAYRFGRGELAARTHVTSGGEIGELSRAFDTMAEQLSATIRERTAERNQIAAVLSHMHDGIILTDALGAIQQINPAAARLFRTTPQRAVGRSLVEVTHSHELHQGLHGVLTRPGDRQRVELTAGYFQITAVITAIPGFAAAGPTVLFVLQDVSELRRLERVRRDFVANIGHELRTPLASTFQHSGIRSLEFT